MAHTSYNQPEALRLLALDSEEAFNEIFAAHYAKINGFAFRFLKDKELAKEVVQEVFIIIWQKRKDLIHINNFDAYLYTTTSHLAIASLKQIAKRDVAKQAFLDDLSIDDDPTYHTLLINEVERVVELLPPQQKLIFRLAKKEGLSYEAIAKKLKISPQTVNWHLKIAYAFIREKVPHYASTAVVFLFSFLGIGG
jgi:RNA polymerase sigma-70 factor (family 1)